MLKRGFIQNRYKKLMDRRGAGFTLIELLIVIAVIGILAVAVLAAINPIEQVNRSSDTGSLSDSEQLISAIDRYYASTLGTYPWMVDTTDTLAVNWTKVSSSWVQPTGNNVLDNLSESGGTGTGELKQSYVDKLNKSKNPLYLYNKGLSGDSNYVCFKSLSSSFKVKAETRCTDGLPDDLLPQHDQICGITEADVFYTCLP